MRILKSAAFILACLLALPVHAAYVASGSAVGTVGSDVVAVTDPGCSTGNMILMFVAVGGGATETVTWPSGFTQVTTANNTGANRGHTETLLSAYSTTMAPSYSATVNGGGGTTPLGIIVCNSGRSTSAPTNYAASSNVNGGNSPISIGLTGVTALASDDLIWVGVPNQLTTGSYTFTAPSTMTSQQSQSYANASLGSAINLSTKDALSAGATGTLTGTATLSGQNADALGIVISIAAAGGGSCTHSGITSAGAIAVPNGTTGSYRGKTGNFVTPDCSSIQYFQPTVGNFGTT